MQYIKDLEGFRFKDVEARQDIEALKNKKAIIDVTELPENGIDVTSIYRLKSPEVYASFRGTQNMFYNIPISWEVVDALPAEGSACTDANESFIKLYYQRSDKLAYGYLTAELSGAEAQWMEASALWVAMNIETAEFGGYITTEDQATNSSMVYIVTPDVTYSLYHYKDGWKVVGEVTTEVVDQKIEEALEDYAKTEDIPTDYVTESTVNSKIAAAIAGIDDENTTYSFVGGTNSFTVTPSGGTAQTITITPSVTKANVGLGNVDNTSDMNKPVSTAQKAALNAKADKTYVDTELAKKQVAGDYATSASVDSKIDAAVKGLLGDGVDAAYDTFVEIQKLMKADDTQSADLIAKVNKNAKDIAALEGLPAVSTSDNGKFLVVTNGVWTATTMPIAEDAEV